MRPYGWDVRQIMISRYKIFCRGTVSTVPEPNHICHKEIYKKARYSAARGLAALPCKHIQGQNILQQAPAAIYVRGVEDAAPYQPLKVPH